MRRSASSLLAASAEALSWALVAGAWGGGAAPSGARVLAFLVAHGVASAAVAFLLCDLLPPAFRAPAWPTRLALFTVAFFLPLVGPLGLVGAFAAAWLWPARPPSPSPFVITEVPDLPFRPLRFRQRLYTEGHLTSLLRHSRDAGQRIKAVMSLRQVPSRLSLPLLSAAIQDPVDDVRLLAYSMIDGQEREIFGRVRRATEALPAAVGDEAVLLHRRLAEDHWELAYLGLATGAALARSLAASRHHAEVVAGARPDDGAIHLLLGRVLLRQGRLEEAERALAHAWSLGQPDAQILWQLAEVAFLQRRFDEVRRLLGFLGPEARRRPPLSRVVGYWT